MGSPRLQPEIHESNVNVANVPIVNATCQSMMYAHGLSFHWDPQLTIDDREGN